MKALIKKAVLKRNEINLLNKAIEKFPNPVFLTKRHWQELNTAYIAKINRKIAGICSVTRFNSWFKLGPFIVIKQYQGKGMGKMILEKIVQDYKHSNLFIGSRNPIVWSIVKKFGFKEEQNFWLLPWEIKVYLLRSLLWCFNLQFIKELIRKKSINQGRFRFFLKNSN